MLGSCGCDWNEGGGTVSAVGVAPSRGSRMHPPAFAGRDLCATYLRKIPLLAAVMTVAPTICVSTNSATIDLALPSPPPPPRLSPAL